MWSLSRLRPVALAAALAASLLVLPSSTYAEPGPNPGLPLLENPAGFPPVFGDLNTETWLNAPYTGLAGSTRAKQWTRLPLGTLAASIVLASCVHPRDPTQNVCEFPVPDDLTGFYATYGIQAFLVSPDGSSEPYGFGTVATTRSLAFGALPVEIDLQVEQVRDSDGLPVPIVVSASDYQAGATNEIQVYESATLRGQIHVIVKDVRVDGVDVDLLESCRTAATELNAVSQYARVLKSEQYTLDPRSVAFGIDGGGLQGEIDIPPFSGCITANGDDISGILTSSISGDGNPVLLQYGQAGCFVDLYPGGFFKPTQPGQDTPAEAGCQQRQVAPDQNPDFYTVPLPYDIPDYAPGATAP